MCQMQLLLKKSKKDKPNKMDESSSTGNQIFFFYTLKKILKFEIVLNYKQQYFVYQITAIDCPPLCFELK